MAMGEMLAVAALLFGTGAQPAELVVPPVTYPALPAAAGDAQGFGRRLAVETQASGDSAETAWPISP